MSEPVQPPEQPEQPPDDPADIRTAARLIGLDFTEAQAASVGKAVAGRRADYEALRSVELDATVPSALRFTPSRRRADARAVQAWDGALPAEARPAGPDELAWCDVHTLAALVRAREVSCVELTELALRRLEKADPVLHCVVTLTAERALVQARERDRELEAGRWRGPLHGIPWGAKDLLAVRGYPTTWGSTAYREQALGVDATVVRRLDDAGAVLVAKLSLGELAMGDVWFGGQTRNPWDTEKGSSGSSAGSAAAVASGCVPFAIGSETLGSILSPSAVCGCSSLRPTYGTVSRHGAMALAPTLDKLGPICRTVRDAALVFDAIRGPDGLDDTVVESPFAPPQRCDVRGWRVGFLERPFEKVPESRSVLTELESLGVELVPLRLPELPASAMLVILAAESAESFDELTRSGRDQLLVNQDGWPASFRAARLVPAVEYLRANRLRSALVREMDDALAGVDAYVHPGPTSLNLAITNLTGHPSVAAPCGFADDGTPRGIAFTGRPYDEARVLALADAWQRSTGYHHRHPTL